MTSREALELELNAFPAEMRRLLSLHVLGEVGAQARLSLYATLGYLRQRVQTARDAGDLTARQHLALMRRLDRLRRGIYNACRAFDALADEGNELLDPLAGAEQMRLELVL